MKSKNVLILTDHTNHSAENSLYDLAVKMLAHQKTQKVDVVSRANVRNDSFFNCNKGSRIYATSIDQEFAYSDVSHPLNQGSHEIDNSDYDLVWLRLPPPLSSDFLQFVDTEFSKAMVINNPKGILTSGSKEFLMNFAELSPPMKICHSLKDIIAFKTKFPIVLKPFRAYGGQGLVKVNGNKVFLGNTEMSFQEFEQNYALNPINYLGVKYLKYVGKGDKRIVVVNGEILGASLRLPPKDSWICNVSMGGSSNLSDVDTDEIEMVKKINPVLSKLGVVMYGVDTLVGDDGRRVLSEINTTSIGGLPQIANMKKLPLVEKAIDLIWSYYEANLPKHKINETTN